MAALAIAKIGGIVAAISTFSTAREIAWTLEHSGPSALITVWSLSRACAISDALYELCPELAGSAPGAAAKRAAARVCATVVCHGRAARTTVSSGSEDFLARGTGVGRRDAA